MNINYYQKFIDFFERHKLYDKETFDYLREHSILFDYRDTDYHPFMGCFYITKKNKLEKINLIVPYIDNDITASINIHEYTHGIVAYNYMNKPFAEDITIEILPLLYERIYLEENKDNERLERHVTNINKIAEASNSPEIAKYKIALNMQDDLLDYYYSGHTSIKELDKKARKLVKKQNCNL